jgi:hypothetical protein
MAITMAEEPISETRLSARRPNPESNGHEDALLAFAEVRPCLFGIAYRMLGSALKPRTLSKTFGCGGKPPIEVWLKTHPRF